MNSSFQHCAYNQIPTTELHVEPRLEMAAMVCRFPRERRCPNKPDVCESRGQDLLYGKAPVSIVPFGIFTRLRIPQNDNAARLQKWHPTVESLPCAVWRLVAIE
jgi:hypothetical protein